MPEATPEPTREKRTAFVLPESGLNLRAHASRTSGVIMTLPQGTMLDVRGYEQSGMLPVALGSLEGYVASEYVYVATESQLNPATPTPSPTLTPTPAPQPVYGTATVTAQSGLKLREAPHTGGRTITTMPYGTVVKVTGAESGGFLPVSYGTLSGYASASYLRMEAADQTEDLVVMLTPVPTAEPTKVPAPSGQVTGRTAMVTAQSGVNLRADSNTYSDVIATLAYGVEVVVTGEWISGYYPVRVGTLGGYVSADYLRFGESAPQTATPEPTVTPQPGGYRVLAASDNGLNLRSAPNTDSSVVYVLPYGMVLTVLDESENGFLHVQWAGYTGYVSKEFVTPFGAQ